MTDVIETEQDTAPVETPAAQLPQESTDDSELDRLLQEYTDATSKPEPDLRTEELNPETAPIDQSLDQQIQDLIGPDPKIGELQGRLNDLRTQLHRESEIKAYHDYADDLQKHIQESNPNVPDGWTKLMMDSFAHNPEIALAWDTRNINPSDAARDLAFVQHNLNQLKDNPDADPKQVQELNQLAYRLDIAARSPAILRQCRNQILSEARKLKPPIDEQVTADVAAMTQYIRDGLGAAQRP